MNKIEFGIARNREEFEGIKELCESVFDKEVSTMADDLLNRAPVSRDYQPFYACDRENNKIVGCLFFLEVPVRYENIYLPAAEYGIAATDKNYRGRGINKKLTEKFFDYCNKTGISLVVLEGIPYFYRRYGFNYAVPLADHILELENLNLVVDRNIKLRKAVLKDVDYIYNEFENPSIAADFCKVKDKSIIAAQIISYKSETLKKEYYIIESGPKKIGYFALDREEDRLVISDISDNLSFNTYQTILKYLIENVVINKKNKAKIYINIPDNSKFILYTKTLGGRKNEHYCWQLKIIDEFSFLENIKPVLEKRIKESKFRGEDISFNYNNYQDSIKFDFQNNNLSLTRKNREGSGDINLSPQGAVKLFTGYNTLDDITEFLPDCQVSGKYWEVINILFPEMNSHFYINY